MTAPAFNRLIERHGRELFAYLFRMTRQPQEAEDCLQETYLRAFKAYARLDGRANHRAWLYKIATNVALTHLRRRSRDDSRTLDWTAQAHQPVVGEGADDPAKIADANELRSRVDAAVRRLPARQRAALVLRNYQQLSYAEIAASIGGTPEAARANVYQALKRLREELGD